MVVTKNIPSAVKHVLYTLQSNGYEAELVGGCVRDMLLSRPVNDYDIATSALPMDVVRLFSSTRGTGLKHGTVTVASDPACAVEVTTYRAESAYSDGRHPDSVTFGATLYEDLARRDFTVNAMALTESGQIIDPFEGQTDLFEKRIRAVGVARDRFSEDSLRILRAIRFAAQLSFQVEQTTLAAMNETSEGLCRVSKERIGEEFSKIARANWWHVVSLLANNQFLTNLPEPIKHMQHYFESLSGIQADRQKNWNNRFPKTDEQTYSLATWSTWLMFADDPELTARSLFKQFALGIREAKVIGTIAGIAKQELENWSTMKWRETFFHVKPAWVQIAAKIRDGLCFNTQVSYEQLFSSQASIQPIWSRTDLAITAEDLVSFGMTGPQIGQAFTVLCDAVLSGEIENTKLKLIAYLKNCLVEGRV